MKHLFFTILGVAMGLTAGCSSMVTVAPSTSPITAKDTYTKLGHTKGQSGTLMLFCFLPFGSSQPSKDAVAEALEAKKANALIEVTEDYKSLNLLLFQYNWTTVEGTAIKFERKGEEVE